jgi:hypothetical protein
LPVTVPLNSGATVAVKVTDCPKFDGFSEEVKVGRGRGFVYHLLTTFDVLPAKVESPGTPP